MQPRFGLALLILENVFDPRDGGPVASIVVVCRASDNLGLLPRLT
jgi:hypothetical protein